MLKVGRVSQRDAGTYSAEVLIYIRSLRTFEADAIRQMAIMACACLLQSHQNVRIVQLISFDN